MKTDISTSTFNLAAIDIGSNAARLLVKSVRRDEDGVLHFQKLQFVRFPLRLGVDVFFSRKISDEREVQFVRLMKAYRQLMKLYKVKAYRACATSALRDARNGRKILRRIKKEVGIGIEIISGEEEARTIYNTHIEKLLAMSASATEDGCKQYLYVDVGGGSTEVSCIEDGELKASRSFNIGTLRLLSGMAGREQMDEMCRETASMVNVQKPCSIIGSGGNINKLYRLVPKNSRLKDALTLHQLEMLHGQLSALSVEERIREFDLRPDRADVIVPAASIFLQIARAVHAEDIVVPTMGLSDGIINALAVKAFE